MDNGIITTMVRSLHLCWTTFVLIVIFVIGNIECDVNMAPSYTHSILVVCQLLKNMIGVAATLLLTDSDTVDLGRILQVAPYAFMTQIS
jgi:hypothetical protein